MFKRSKQAKKRKKKKIKTSHMFKGRTHNASVQGKSEPRH